MSSSITPTTTPTSSPSTTPSATTPPSNSGQTSGPQSSPLLFFVALGFGVVFTNLWIIVGVKYCFRYNARNRPRHDENGDPIDLANMPRQHRRRREKKLMSLDEVNQRFPITKYKAWVSNRAEEGLPTAGGVAAPSSRPASIKEQEPLSSEEEREQSSAEAQRPATATSSAAKEEGTTTTTAAAESTHANQSTTITEPPPAHLETYVPPPHSAIGSEDADADDDDPIHAAVPAEMLANPGDTCAICIDTLEDDDDVRGLTCGHAFHASCVDPWLTSRRACCPLCKADYYTPKPRPEGEQSQEADRVLGRRPSGRMDLQAPALHILTGRREGRSRSNRHDPRYRRRDQQVPQQQRQSRTSRFFGFPRFTRRPSQPRTPTSPAHGVIARTSEMNTDNSNNNNNDNQNNQQHWSTRFRPSMPRPQLAFWRRNQNGSDAATDAAAQSNEAPPTPSQLEAGSR